MPMPAIFLELEGTLSEGGDACSASKTGRLTLTATAALQLWCAGGYQIVVLASEGGAAEGADEASASNNERELRVLFDDIGVPLAGYHSCPPRVALADNSERGDDCRPPAPGLVAMAAESLGVSPSVCWVVGNALDHVEAGSRAGCTTVLLDTGGEREWRLTPWRIPDYLAHDLLEAAEIVIATEEAAWRVESRDEMRLPTYREGRASPSMRRR